MSFTEIMQWVLGVLIGLPTVIGLILPFGGYQRLTGKITETMPVTAEDFQPEVRFVVFSDSHNQNHHVADAIDTAYELFDNDEKYPGVDAFFGLGDFSSVGQEGDFVRYVDTLREHVREETKCINILGNHEMKDDNNREYFIRNFGYDPNTVTEINGFSFIAFSGVRGATEWTFTPSSLLWLSRSIREAEAKSDTKPVFVLQHPHAWGTVYGSTFWGNPQLNLVFNKHNRVVSFSGHSHFPMNDPRSIIQTSYTCVGVGAMATFELDKNFIPGQHPDGYDPAAQMCIVEADSDGSVRILEYDLLSDTFFNEYYIDNVNDTSSWAYTYRNRRAHDSKPVFSEDTFVRAYRNEAGEWVISFNEAHCDTIVHDYKIRITDSKGKTVVSDTFVDDYFVIDDDDTADFRIGTDALEEGQTYTMTVTAVSAYGYRSDCLTLSFTA
ncbi:MAG: metallophosphoesterase [Clostridia bacterium]|nr:metallophosphoesterase [Clostridia bacterium]